MTRTWIVLTALAALGLIGIGHSYLIEEEKTEAPPPATAFTPDEDPRIMGVLNAYLPAVEHPDAAQRRAGLVGLSNSLLGKGLKQVPMKQRTQEKLAQTLIKVYGQASDGSLEAVEARKAVVRILCARTNTPLTKRFIINILISSPQEMRAEALNSLGKPEGLRGEDLNARILELIGDGRLGSSTPRALVVVKGPKAKGELLNIAKTTVDTETFKAAALELQAFKDVKAMETVVGRLAALGFTELDGDLSWLDGKLVAKVLDRAQGEDVMKVLEVVASEPTLTRDCLDGIRHRLDHEDGRVRKLAAGLVGAAVLAENFEPHAAERLLIARLERETDPEVSKSMHEDLARVQEEREALEAGVPQK